MDKNIKFLVGLLAVLVIGAFVYGTTVVTEDGLVSKNIESNNWSNITIQISQIINFSYGEVYDQSLNTTDDVEFENIKSNNWSNITIQGSQIINFSSSTTILTYIDSSLICYQESANLSTLCIRRNSGEYYPGGQWTDGNWNTYSSNIENLYVNYTIPDGVTNESIFQWAIGHNGVLNAYYNYTLNEIDLEAEKLQVWFDKIGLSENRSSYSLYLYFGGGWQFVAGGAQGSSNEVVDLIEEAVFWKFNSTNSSCNSSTEKLASYSNDTLYCQFYEAATGEDYDQSLNTDDGVEFANITVGQWTIKANTTTLELYQNGDREAIWSSDGTLHIKGNIITNDETV